MRYYNINNPDATTDFQNAVTDCIGDKGGLYIPASFPVVPQAFINNMGEMSLKEIAYVTSNIFFGSDIKSETIKHIVDNAFPDDFPMMELPGNKYVFELFHGPTLTFKDIGIRFLAGLLQHLSINDRRNIKVLVSSTGNTAAAVIDAFDGLSNIDVFVLQPKKAETNTFIPHNRRASENVHMIQVDGNIDDCKTMITSAMTDAALKEKALMTSANSVNIARIIAQVAFFFYAAAKLRSKLNDISKIDFSLPSGNLSLLAAGVFAKKIGLQFGKLIAACNANNNFDIYIKTGRMSFKPTVSTPARFMDTSAPSNFPRINALYHDDIDAIRHDISSASIGNVIIDETIFALSRSGYIADPHTAVGIAALDRRPDNSVPGVAFATAHPKRSLDYMHKICGLTFEQYQNCVRFDNKAHKKVILPPTYPALRKFILSHNNN